MAISDMNSAEAAITVCIMGVFLHSTSTPSRAQSIEIVKDADRFYPTSISCNVGSATSIRLESMNHLRHKAIAEFSYRDSKPVSFAVRGVDEKGKQFMSNSQSLQDAADRTHRYHAAFAQAAEAWLACNSTTEQRQKYEQRTATNLRSLQLEWRRSGSRE
jgi:hypothetical protein